jgi:hypothetical protein
MITAFIPSNLTEWCLAAALIIAALKVLFLAMFRIKLKIEILILNQMCDRLEIELKANDSITITRAIACCKILHDRHEKLKRIFNNDYWKLNSPEYNDR